MRHLRREQLAVADKASRVHMTLPKGEPVAHQGWMWKRGGAHGGMRNWRKRWFVLIGESLFYMEQRNDPKVLGRVILTGMEFRHADEEVKKPHAIGIYNKGNLHEAPFYCHTESEVETEQWLVMLQGGAKGKYQLSTAESMEPAQSLAQIAQIAREFEPERVMRAELEVSLVEARGLSSRGGSESDPYCVLQCGIAKFETNYEPQTLSPRWDETFTFQVTSSTSQLQIDVYDRAPARGERAFDDFLGLILVPLQPLMQVDCAHLAKF